MQRLIVVFRKADAARYLSHLDLLSTLEFAIRRARLPVALTEGFNPRPRMSLAAPLALGYTGEREILELTLTDCVEPEEVRERLSGTVPAGIDILFVEVGSQDVKSAASRVQSAEYRVELPHSVANLEQRIQHLLDSSTLEITEKREAGIRTRDIRPLIVSVTRTDDATLHVIVRHGDAGSARPEQLLDLLAIPRDGVLYTRERINLG